MSDDKQLQAETSMIAATIRPSTVERYTKQLRLFQRWRSECGTQDKPLELAEIRRYFAAFPYRAQHCWPALQKFVLPSRLERISLMVRGIRRARTSDGGLPIEPALAMVAAERLLARGDLHWAAALVLQSAFALRRSELFQFNALRIHRDHIAMSWSSIKNSTSAVERVSYNAKSVSFLRSLPACIDDLLLGQDAAKYASALQSVLKSMLGEHFVSHGVRIGSVTYWHLSGVPEETILRRLGWSSKAMLKTYVQVNKLLLVRQWYSKIQVQEGA